MTKSELAKRLERAVELGDQLSEMLEGLTDDPVITEYLRVRRDYELPFLWMERDDGKSEYRVVNAEWDELVGELQEAGVVHQDIQKGTAYELREKGAELID